MRLLDQEIIGQRVCFVRQDRSIRNGKILLGANQDYGDMKGGEVKETL